jgi:hypothetical protein
MNYSRLNVQKTAYSPFWREKIRGFCRKSEDFAENPLPRISMFTSSRVWSDFARISQQILGFQIEYIRYFSFSFGTV